MANVNKVILIGNLTRDPELRVTPKGTAICQFGLAVNRKWREENEQADEIEPQLLTMCELGVKNIYPNMTVCFQEMGSAQ